MLGGLPENYDMPRYIRCLPPGSLVHVIGRYLNREFLVQHEEERASYLRFLERALKRTDWVMLSYGLMSSHNHWGAIAGTTPFSQLSMSVNSSFARWYNRRHGRLGPVFADRPRTLLVSPTDAAYLIGYHHNNPVRAGVVGDATESTWTSHRAYLGLDAAPPWLDVDLGLKLSRFGDDVAGFAKYVGSNALRVDPVLSGHDMDEDRRTLREALSAAIEVGSPSCQLRVRRLSYPVVGGDGVIVRPPWKGSLEAVLEAVSLHTTISKENIRSKRRSKELSYARRLVVLAGCEVLGKSLTDMAKLLNTSAEGVRYHLRASDLDEESIKVAAALVEVVKPGPFGCDRDLPQAKLKNLKPSPPQLFRAVKRLT